MAPDSAMGVGRAASGPHAYTLKTEAFLRERGDQGATLDEIVAKAVDEQWISRGFANRMYAGRINEQRQQDRLSNKRADVGKTIMTPALVEMQGLYPNAVRWLLRRALEPGNGRWCRREGNRWYATGRGFKRKPSGWTEEQINQTPEQIGADMAMREVIRMLRPYKHQETHKVTQAEWKAIRHWLNLAAIDWQP